MNAIGLYQKHQNYRQNQESFFFTLPIFSIFQISILIFELSHKLNIYYIYNFNFKIMLQISRLLLLKARLVTISSITYPICFSSSLSFALCVLVFLHYFLYCRAYAIRANLLFYYLCLFSR